jgi:hypothetical protein
MKNQLFGENRDLLKFDLVQHVLQSKLVDQFLYVPMLTPDDPDYKAENICRHESSGGAANEALLNFLDFCVINEKRQVGQLEKYFQQAGFGAKVYSPDLILTQENRKAYFEDLVANLAPRSLVLLDPDQGLEEVNNTPSNLKYSEIRSIYQGLDEDSILMFTQRFPYEMYEEYLGMRTAEIKDQVPFSQPVSLDDLDSIIFFLPKSTLAVNQLVHLLKEYTRQYYQKAE